MEGIVLVFLGLIGLCILILIRLNICGKKAIGGITVATTKSASEVRQIVEKQTRFKWDDKHSEADAQINKVHRTTGNMAGKGGTISVNISTEDDGTTIVHIWMSEWHKVAFGLVYVDGDVIWRKVKKIARKVAQ